MNNLQGPNCFLVINGSNLKLFLNEINRNYFYNLDLLVEIQQRIKSGVEIAFR